MPTAESTPARAGTTTPACPGRPPARRRGAGRPRRRPPAPASRVDAPLDRHRPQGPLHVGVDHVDDTLGGDAGPVAAAERGGQVEAPSRRRRLGRDPPGHQVGVGDRGLGPAPAVAGRARVGARRLRAATTRAPPGSMRAIDPPPAPMVWTSSDGNRIGEPAHLPLGRRGGSAAEDEADVGRGAAHVEGDGVGEAVGGRRGRRRPARRRPARTGAGRPAARRRRTRAVSPPADVMTSTSSARPSRPAQVRAAPGRSMALTTVVTVRSYSRISGDTSCEQVTSSRRPRSAPPPPARGRVEVGVEQADGHPRRGQVGDGSASTGAT